jgi:hypothetical protein
MTLQYYNTDFSGVLDNDTVRIAGIEVQDQVFEEFTHVHHRFFPFIDVAYDGVLGLAPPSSWQTGFNYPNYLQVLQDGNLLEKNIMSLKLPAGIGKKGEIMFGDMNPDRSYTSSLLQVFSVLT